MKNAFTSLCSFVVFGLFALQVAAESNYSVLLINAQAQGSTSQWHRTKDLIIDYLDTLNADIIMMSEVEQAAINDLETSVLGTNYNIFYNTGTNNPIIIKKFLRAKLQSDAIGICSTGNAVMISDGTTRFKLYNNHFCWPSEEDNLVEAQWLGDAIASLPPTMKVLAGGDVNMTANHNAASYAYLTSTGEYTDTGADLTDIWSDGLQTDTLKLFANDSFNSAVTINTYVKEEACIECSDHAMFLVEMTFP